MRRARRGGSRAGARRAAAPRRHRRPLHPRREPDLVDAGGDVACGLPDRAPGTSWRPASATGWPRPARSPCRRRWRCWCWRASSPPRPDAPRMGTLGQRAHPPGHRRRGGLRAGRRAGAAVPVRGSAAQAQAVRARSMGRGTPLETLDRLALRCVSVGFPIFTVAIVTGAIWVARLGLLAAAVALRPEYLLRGGDLGRRSACCWSRGSARAGAGGAPPG